MLMLSATGCRKEIHLGDRFHDRKQLEQSTYTLIEMGYMSNPSEDRRMQQTSYQKKMVRGIANGIEDYLVG